MLIILSLPYVVSASIIAGNIEDIDSGEPVPFVNVYIKNTNNGDMADSAGYFQIDDIEPGNYTLIVRMIGYETYKDTVSVGNTESRYLNISIKRKSIEMEGVEVKAERSAFRHDISISKRTYSKQDIMDSPSFIEPDVLKVFQMMPSVTAVSDFSSALYVRGGAPDQNLILFDNVPVFNPFHLGGLFSTFPANAVKSASFMAGAFGADYGNRMSSVIDIKTIVPDRKTFSGHYDISLLSSTLYLSSNPFDDLSFFINGRRTYFDKILDIIDYDFPYYFYDIVTKVNYSASDRSNLSLSYFKDRDILNLILEDTLQLFDNRWGNSSAGLTYSHMLNPLTFMKVNIYQTQYSNTLNLLDIMHAGSSVSEMGIKTSINYSSKAFEWEGGFEYYENDFKYSVIFSDTNTLFDLDDTSGYYSAYLTGQYKKEGEMIIQAGLRGEGSSMNPHYYISPRINAKMFLFNETALTISYGIYRQFITSVKQETNDFSSVFGEMWMPVYDQYDPQLLRQMIIGTEHWFNTNTMMTIELYHKKYENLVHSTLLDLIINMEDPEKAFMETEGKSQGLEILIKRNAGRVTGWLGYTYSGTYLLRDSQYVYTYYDKRHSLNINASVSLPWKCNFSTGLVFSSGSPYTAVTGKYRNYSIDPGTGTIEEESWSEIYAGYNEARFPSYFRWDLSLSKSFNIGYVKSKINLSVVNVTNHKNVMFYYYDHSTSPSTRHEFYMLPIFPSIGVSGEF